jgi:hypothetical protein
MARYSITRNKNEIHIFGYNQEFTKADVDSLWLDHKILYLRGSIMAVWIEERKNTSPLVHLMFEDDGHIFWSKEKDVCFDVGWVNYYIDTFSTLKNLLSIEKLR